MRNDVTISYRGARYEIGRGQHFYGIWPAGGSRAQPVEWWPETPEGWYGAWSRFSTIEAPGTIVQVSVPAGATAVPAEPAPLVAVARTRAIIAAALLGIGVGCGIAGLFPDYFTGSSLAHESAELVPHVIYLAAWTASAVLILLGGTRLRVGVLLGIGTSVVTFGLFFADLGTAVAGRADLIGAGLVLSLVGWLACAAGSATAFGIRSAGAPRRVQRHPRGPILTLTLATLAALGAAGAFAPSWDSYTLRTSTGATESLTAGNAFANPALVITGDVVVMVALVAVVVAAAAWRPARIGAALLAGAIIPMAAQAISAFILLSQSVAPQQFGISPAQAAQAGLTISSGGTPAFWIYIAFVVALIAICARMLIQPRPAAEPRPSAPDAAAQHAAAQPVPAQPAPAPHAAATQPAHAQPSVPSTVSGTPSTQSTLSAPSIVSTPGIATAPGAPSAPSTPSVPPAQGVPAATQPVTPAGTQPMTPPATSTFS